MKRLMLLAALLISAAALMSGCDEDEKHYREPGPLHRDQPGHESHGNHGHHGY